MIIYPFIQYVKHLFEQKVWCTMYTFIILHENGPDELQATLIYKDYITTTGQQSTKCLVLKHMFALLKVHNARK